MFLEIVFLLIVIFTVGFTEFAREGYKINANFAKCYAWLNSQSNASLSTLSANGTLYGNPSQRFLTVPGCYQHCGPGYRPWPFKEIADRFSLWVFPAFILFTHFNFAPLGTMNYLAIIAHAAGDPIDSLWSILTRFEVNRRILRVAEMAFIKQEDEKGEAFQTKRKSTKDITVEGHEELRVITCEMTPTEKNLPLSRASLSRFWKRIHRRFRTRHSAGFEHIATIWAAYEEIGWQDATSRVLERAESLDINESQWTLIKQASYDLSSRRQSSLVLIFIPILSLAGAIGLAIVKTIQQIEQSNTRLANETAHTIAVVCLLFIFIPLVAFSGSIGAVTTVTAAVDTINKLRHDLTVDQNPDMDTLFPCLIVHSGETCSECCPKSNAPPITNTDAADNDGSESDPETHDSSHGPDFRDVNSSSDNRDSHRHDFDTVSADINVKNWSRIAGYMGMNSIWRPCKHIRPVSQRIESDSLSRVPFWRKPFRTDSWKHMERSSGRLLFWSFFFVVCGAAVPALFLSMTNRATRRYLGLGCRSLSWLTVLGSWLLSFADDWYLRRSFRRRGMLLAPCLYKNPKSLWRWTIAKDLFCVAIITVLISLQQSGVYNSCYCRASFNKYINLQPYTDWEWHRAKVLWASIPTSFFLFNLVIITWLMLVGGRATSILRKGEDRLEADLEQIERARGAKSTTSSVPDGASTRASTLLHT